LTTTLIDYYYSSLPLWYSLPLGTQIALVEYQEEQHPKRPLRIPGRTEDFLEFDADKEMGQPACPSREAMK
jgi:hypothetical protein